MQGLSSTTPARESVVNVPSRFKGVATNDPEIDPTATPQTRASTNSSRGRVTATYRA